MSGNYERSTRIRRTEEPRVFMIKLAILGLILAFAWYCFMELPIQAAIPVPTNAPFS